MVKRRDGHLPVTWRHSVIEYMLCVSCHTVDLFIVIAFDIVISNVYHLLDIFS